MSDRDPRPEPVQHLRVPPHSTEAEQSLLGALLVDNGAMDRMPPLRAGDFYRWEHRQIFETVQSLVMANRPADVVTVNERLVAALGDQAADIGVEYLNAMALSVPSASNAPAYAAIVLQCATRRRMISLFDEMVAQAYGTGAAAGVDPDDLIGRAVTELMALGDGRRTDEPQDMEPLTAAFIDDLQERADGRTDAIATGLLDLDRLTGEGGRRGELWVVGARPSMGKTAFVLHLCRNVGRMHRVLMLTQEDSLMSLTQRHVAAAGAVNLSHLRNPQRAPDSMWSGVTEGVTVLRDLQISMDDQGSLKLGDVRRKLQQVKRRHKDCALVVIDYLQLMDGETDNRNHSLGALANGLKAMAKDMNCWVILLSQLNREADKRSGPPQMSDLRDSGDIEGAADFIGLLHRQYMRTRKDADKHDAELHVVKHKNGPTGSLRFFFDGARQVFADASHGGGAEEGGY